MEDTRRRELHPLQNIDTLEIIFKNLNDTDLKSCREVCKVWCNCCAQFMRSYFKIQIVNEENSQKSLMKFLELVECQESSFFISPFVNRFRINGGIVDNPRFWNACGKYIKYLELADVRFQSANAFRTAIFQSCTNLEKLKLMPCEVYGEPIQKAVEWMQPKYPENKNLKSLTLGCIDCIGWMEILSQFPSLQSLDVMFYPRPLTELFRCLEIVWDHDKTYCNLKKIGINFDLMGTETSMVTAVLSKGNIALESLKVTEIYDNKLLEPLQTIIMAHAASLKKLFVSGYDIEECMKSMFSVSLNGYFENLREIRVPEWFLLPSMRFLRYIPNLEKLELDIDEAFMFDDEIDFVSGSCTELILNCNEYEVWNKDIKMLCKLLPNITKLNVDVLYNDTFEALCEGRPNLIDLCIGGCIVDDAGISGFDEEDVERINQNGPDRDWRPITVPRANLSSLRHLQKFWCHCINETVPGYCAAAYAVLELPQLEQLHIKSWDEGWNLEEFWIPIQEEFPFKYDKKSVFYNNQGFIV